MPRLHGIDASIVLNEIYDVQFGINYHGRDGKKASPFSLVEMNKAEDPLEGSMLKKIAKSYIDNSIYENYHLDLFQFMNLPVSDIDLLIEAATEEKVKKLQKAKEAADDLKNQLVPKAPL